MSLALGIDTGGTYTDAALVDYESGRVLASAKALTTKHDLMLGICAAIDQVLAEPREIGLVSLSTTLATNAIVEGQGAPVGAILIGYEGRIAPDTNLASLLNTPWVAAVAGGHDSSGVELAPLDHDALAAAIARLQPHVAAFAVSGYFGTRNPEHELAARALIRRMTDLPVTCGHELSSRLDALRRATTVALNASLIPLVCDLLDAVSSALRARGIAAPLMVVKGDGSLISADMARERPVETILSGPAASVVGATALGGARDTVVVDMGGTTTDISVIREGMPVLSAEGAMVGGWQTMVEAIEVYTCGLGGDSQVSRDSSGELHIGPERVVPLAIMARNHPQALQELRSQARRGPQPGDGQFLLLQRAHWRQTANAPSFEPALYAALQDGPVSAARLREIVAHPGLYTRYLERLVREGLVVRSGLTPTDCAHVLGWYDDWDAEAAGLGAELFARAYGWAAQELCRRVLDETVRLGAQHTVRAVLASEGVASGERELDDGLMARALGSGSNSLLRVDLHLRQPITAIGAPSPTYWPRSAALLGAPLLVPENAHVANAVGAVAGSVVVRVKAQVTPTDDSGLFVAFVPGGRRTFAELAEAISYAEAECSTSARARAEAAGAQEIRVTLWRDEHSAPVGVDAQADTWLYTDLMATAAGRPALTGPAPMQ